MAKNKVAAGNMPKMESKVPSLPKGIPGRNTRGNSSCEQMSGSHQDSMSSASNSSYVKGKPGHLRGS